MSPARYRQIAIAALIALSVIIVTGAAVRLSNSGLGCDDWPNCSQDRLVDVSSKHAAIEQVNRFFTGIVGIAVIAAVLGSLVRRPRRRDLVVLSMLIAAGVLANAVLGGLSVIVDLHPLAVQAHMLLSMGLIVTATVLVHRSGEPDGGVPRRVVGAPVRRLVLLLFALNCAAVFTGTIVTGAGPHAGDESAERLDVAIPTVARMHGITVLCALSTALALMWAIRRSPADRAALYVPLSTWTFLGALQGAIGYIQYFNGVPALLVGVHIAGATAVMIAVTQVVLATSRLVTEPQTTGAPVAAGAAVGAAAGQPATEVLAPVPPVA